MSKDRKWTLARWALGLGLVISLLAVAGWWFEKDGAAGILAQGLGFIMFVFGLYGAANVAQKSVVSKNYRPELDK